MKALLITDENSYTQRVFLVPDDFNREETEKTYMGLAPRTTYRELGMVVIKDKRGRIGLCYSGNVDSRTDKVITDDSMLDKEVPSPDWHRRFPIWLGEQGYEELGFEEVIA